MKPLRIEARARNNVLWHAIFDHCSSMTAFCELHGLCQVAVSRLLNLKRYPRGTKGWGPLARRLAEITKIPEDDLFPAWLYELPRTRVAVELESKLLPLGEYLMLASPEPTPDEACSGSELKDQVRKALAMLTSREEDVLRMRFGIGEKSERTLKEVGQEFGVGNERIRQIEAKALRKLRHPSLCRDFKVFR